MTESGSRQEPPSCNKRGEEEMYHNLISNQNSEISFFLHLLFALSCIIIFSVQRVMKDDTEMKCFSTITRLRIWLESFIVMVHPVLHSLYSCDSSCGCCFISCGHYFIHPFIRLFQIVSLASSTMCILLRMRQVLISTTFLIKEGGFFLISLFQCPLW